MRQVQIRFIPANGEQPLFGADWRKEVSEQMGKSGIPDEVKLRLFHHLHGDSPQEWVSTDPNKKTGKAPVCFLSSPKWVSVLATGEKSIQLVRDQMMDLVLAANSALGPCGVQHIESELGYRESGSRLYDYVMPQQVCKAQSKEPHTAAYLHARVVAGLNDWAAQFGLDPVFTSSDVLLTKFDRLSPAISWNRQNARWAEHRTRVEFSMPYKLAGWWTAGGQASKGYSFVQFARPTLNEEGA